MMKKLLSPFENKKWLSIVLLVVGIYLLFFHNMWSYDLMDVDETRYVDMSRYMAHTRDFLTLYVNGDYFFEKPPLYFWLETLSFAIFGKVSYVAARFPIACQAFIMCLGLYFVASKVVSKKFGIVAAFISGTGLEFLVLSKVAMIDTLLTTCTVLSVLSGFMTFFCDEKQKKFYWWSFYIFSALGVMAKGIPAFVIPFGVMFFAGIYTKKLKEYFLPQFLLIGFALFFAIVLPWHIVMLIKHNPQFFQEYIMLHHVARFLGSKILDKNEPFYYYFAVVLWGYIPWIFSFIALIVDRLKHVNYVPFDSLSNKDKFLVLNFLALIFTFVFFTTSSSKLATYILPAYPFMSILLADYWLAKENSKSLKFSSIILSSIILFVGLGGCFIKFFLPETIYLYVKEIQVFTCILFSIVGVLSFYFIYKRDKLKLFVTYVVFMILFSAFGAYHIFNIDYKFGQNDLMRFARYAKDNNLKLGSWSVGKKYSLTYYSESNVVFLINVPHPLIEELFDEGYIVVVRNKDLDLIRSSVNFKTISSGTKYSLITR